MSVKTVIRAAALGLTCVALAACSNAPEQSTSGASLVKSLFKGRSQASGIEPAQLAATIQTVLASTSAPVIALVIPNRKAATVMQQIETNHGYATYGIRDRRSVTLRNGLVTATRGLGEDIMSSDVNAVQALISGRRDGTAQRVIRSLDGEDLIEAQVTKCTVRVGATSVYEVAELRTKATSVSETCRGDGVEFTNEYRVAADGRVLQSKFWHSPLNEYITIQALR